MARGRKPRGNTKPIGAVIDADLWREVDEFSRSTGISKRFMMERALAMYLEDAKAGRRPVSRRTS